MSTINPARTGTNVRQGWERTGAELRDRGVDDVLAVDAAINRQYGDLIEATIARFVRVGISFTAEDIRYSINRRHPGAEPHHPNVMGAAIRAASQAGLIEQDGWEGSRRPSRHGNPIRIWRPIGVAA